MDQFCSNHFRSCICRSNLNSYQLHIESHKSANTVRNIRLRGPAAMDYDLEFFVFRGITELGTPDPRPQTTEPQIRNPEPCSIYFLQRGVVLHFQRFDRSCCCSSLRSYINKSQKCRAYFII